MMTEPRLFPAPSERITTDDYYTPAEVFSRLGIRFDVDVAAPIGGAPWVPADAYLTELDDGLSTSWRGRVWMNPPYSNVGPWARKFLHHCNGIALLPHVKATWRNEVWQKAHAIGEVVDGGRSVRFIRNGEPAEIMFPTFFAAMGDECVEALRNIGPIRVLG